MLLSCPAKKVTKERGIGEALNSALPRRKTPSPMYLSRRALSIPPEHLNGQGLITGCNITDSGSYALAALPG